VGRRIEEFKRDPYYLRAKREGYRSRAVYKLMEINRVFNLIKRGDKVLDLGSAPGGWLQYISETVGIDGLVIGVDIKPIKPLNRENIHTITCDIYSDELLRKVREKCEKFDVITSDVSANISGVWDVDVARNIEINLRVLAIADELLKEGGTLISKIFEGRGVGIIIREYKKRFKFVRLYKPKASRKRSAEMYIIGINYKSLKRSKKTV